MAYGSAKPPRIDTKNFDWYAYASSTTRSKYFRSNVQKYYSTGHNKFNIKLSTREWWYILHISYQNNIFTTIDTFNKFKSFHAMKFVSPSIKKVFFFFFISFIQLCVILEPMQELMSRHKAYSLNPRDCLKTTLFQKWQRMVAPPGKRGTFYIQICVFSCICFISIILFWNYIENMLKI